MAASSPATGSSQAHAARIDKAARREAIAGYLFISPYLIITSIFTIGLLFYAFYISMTDLRETFSRTSNFVGLQNYVTALTDGDFLLSLVNVFWYAIIVVILQTIGALLLAIALNAPIKGQRIFRTLFYAPSVASSVVVSLIFLWLYIRTGFVNYFLSLLGLPETTAWLQQPNGLFQIMFGVTDPYLKGPSVTWLAIMAMNIFTTIPTLMLLFLAALQDIPGHLYEAAAIDGATGVKAFFSITLPLLRPTVVLVLILGTIGTLQVFDQVAVMTAGGPVKTTLVPAYLIYAKTLGTPEISADAGLAAAMAFILAGIIVLATYLQRRFIEQGSERT
ncbi:MAG: sugar ABC transporter permease [Chloroflexaceae bacterium]|jgi:multiple sugar transport system permease protein|nr:sugar ABC transporter permease [Chloroflexaceae bacterium]